MGVGGGFEWGVGDGGVIAEVEGGIRDIGE